MIRHEEVSTWNVIFRCKGSDSVWSVWREGFLNLSDAITSAELLETVPTIGAIEFERVTVKKITYSLSEAAIVVAKEEGGTL